MAWLIAMASGFLVWLILSKNDARLQEISRETYGAAGLTDGVSRESNVRPVRHGIDAEIVAYIAALRAGASVQQAIAQRYGRDADHVSHANASHNKVKRRCRAFSPKLVNMRGQLDATKLANQLQQRALTYETDGQIAAAACAIVAAVRLSDVSGCAASTCLEAVRQSMQRMRTCDDMRRNAFAMPQATVKLLSALPVITVLLAQLLGADVLSFLFGSMQGFACLTLGMLFYAAGLIWMHALIRQAANESSELQVIQANMQHA